MSRLERLHLALLNDRNAALWLRHAFERTSASFPNIRVLRLSGAAHAGFVLEAVPGAMEVQITDGYAPKWRRPENQLERSYLQAVNLDTWGPLERRSSLRRVHAEPDHEGDIRGE
jgi:hypothetical protein